MRSSRSLLSDGVLARVCSVSMRGAYLIQCYTARAQDQVTSIDLDFALPSLKLAVRLLDERESKQFSSRADAAQPLRTLALTQNELSGSLGRE